MNSTKTESIFTQQTTHKTYRMKLSTKLPFSNFANVYYKSCLEIRPGFQPKN